MRIDRRAVYRVAQLATDGVRSHAIGAEALVIESPTAAIASGRESSWLAALGRASPRANVTSNATPASKRSRFPITSPSPFE